jgi:c-di-AMP phosphodiesterase-like protein
MGHRFSDLDCVGAAVGMQSVVEKGFKKNCRIVVDKETTMAKSLIDYVENEKKDIFITVDEGLKYLTQKTLLIIVDTHIPNVVESPEILEKSKRTVVIDHHRKMVNYIDDAIVFFHEPTSSSACEMVAELITYMGENFCSKLQAEAMLSGIMLDTKNFVLRTGVRTFEAAAYLRRNGADVTRVRKMFREDASDYKAKAETVHNMEIYRKYYAISVCDPEGLKEPTVVAAQAANDLLNINAVKASFVMVEYQNKIFISGRSIDEVNVQVILEKLGGGGHLNMAGAQLENTTIEAAIIVLKSTLDTMIQEGDL